MGSIEELRFNWEIYGSFGGRKAIYRNFIDRRLKSLKPSWKHVIPFRSGNASGIASMALDPVEHRFLLCGSYRGNISVVDLENFSQAHPGQPVSHKFIPASNSSNHDFLITTCQWYSKDSSVFVTSSMDQTVKIWDANMMCHVEKFTFENPVDQIHWSVAKSKFPLIAVAQSTSNIQLIDPRGGHALQHLRWKSENVVSVQWSLVNENLLFTGGSHGNISLWDVRSGKSELKTFRNPHKRRSAVMAIRFSPSGNFMVTHDRSRVFDVWDANSLKHKWAVQLEDRRSVHSTMKHLQFELCHDGTRLLAIAPADTEVALLELDSGKPRPALHLLHGHYQGVTSCVYRTTYNQVISSSSDRLVLVWSPEMDEKKPETEEIKENELHQDAWSDEDR
uniref:DNA excision repair protein ERCC-8 n=1 Tax=Acrobeloides nanus TaxID=290746 RepID=A0A914C6C2_9BILA